MTMTVESLYPRLEPLLAQVSKPVQYIGGEVNSVSKDFASAEVRWALMYPDAYEVGQPNQGLAILYELLNERDWMLAERTFSIWPDLAALMRSHGLPQFTLVHAPFELFARFLVGSVMAIVGMWLLFVGIDVIDGNLTEINVTSPTGIRAVANLGGPDIAALIWDRIEARRA